MGRVLLFCCLVLGVCGCASIYQDTNTVMPEGFNRVYKEYTVSVTSEPSGARIDWNGQYIGTTPLSRVLNDRRGMAAPAVITAHAVAGCPRCKTISIPGTEEIPREIHFDLTK